MFEHSFGNNGRKVTVLVMIGCKAYNKANKDVIKPADIWQVAYCFNYNTRRVSSDKAGLVRAGRWPSYGFKWIMAAHTGPNVIWWVTVYVLRGQDNFRDLNLSTENFC